MPLSCSCDFDFESEPGMWLYDFYRDLRFKKLDTARRKRCVSCNNLIDIGDLCIEYSRARYPYNDVEARILGVDPEMNEEPRIPVSPHYHCEHCGEIFLNLTAIGYECISPDENMKELLAEYHDATGFKKLEDGE